MLGIAVVYVKISLRIFADIEYLTDNSPIGAVGELILHSLTYFFRSQIFFM
jgi:hypothetical protein